MGFAAEIKEFLGAAKDTWKMMSDSDLKDAQRKNLDVKSAAEQKEMDDPLNQQLKEAKLAHMKATTGQIGKVDPLKELQRQYWVNAINAQKNPVETGPSTTAAPPTRPAIGASPPEDSNAAPVTNYGLNQAKGGLVRKFAVGGMVDDDDLEDDEVTPEVTPSAMPPAIGGGTSGATDFSAQSRTPTPAVGGVPLPRPKPNAITDALKYGVSQLPPQGAVGMPGSRSRALQGYAQGAGGAPQEDMVKIYRKIDPNGEMGESERNLYAIQSVWQYKMNQQDPQGAAKAAFQMLQTYKTAATRYAALSAAAMKGGNVDEGMKLALKAYAQVPDGNNMKLHMGKDGHINYTVTDEDGKELTGGIATPAEIGAAAMKLATPGGFENHLVQMASGASLGGGTKAPKAPKDKEEGASIPKVADQGTLEDQTGSHVDKYVAAAKAGKDGDVKEFTDNETAGMKNVMFHIRRNNDVTNDEAFRAAQSYITAPEPKKKGDPLPFKVTKTEDTATIRYADGRSVELPMSDYLPLAAMRGKALADADVKAKKAEEDSKKETYGQMFGRASDAGNKVLADTMASPAEIKERLQQNLPGSAPNVSPRAGGPAPAVPAIPTEPYNPRMGQYGRPLPTVPPPDESVP